MPEEQLDLFEDRPPRLNQDVQPCAEGVEGDVIEVEQRPPEEVMPEPIADLETVDGEQMEALYRGALSGDESVYSKEAIEVECWKRVAGKFDEFVTPRIETLFARTPLRPGSRYLVRPRRGGSGKPLVTFDSFVNQGRRIPVSCRANLDGGGAWGYIEVFEPESSKLIREYDGEMYMVLLLSGPMGSSYVGYSEGISPVGMDHLSALGSRPFELKDDNLCIKLSDLNILSTDVREGVRAQVDEV